MEAAKTLIRTTVRTFFPHPKQILIIDALMLHSVLHIEDLAVLLSSQPKDIRSFLTPLRSARLLSTHTRVEARVGSTRGIQRDYYYCPFHPAIDAIKFRIAKLRRRVEALYQQDETKRKDWRCPRCKAEYEELEILDKTGNEGFYCEKCGSTLVQNEEATQERGSHEKIRKLNVQLAKFDDLIMKIDRLDIPENDFLSAWERKKDVPRERGGRAEGQYIELKRDAKRGDKGPELVKLENLEINITSGAEQEREDAERKEERKKKVALQNLLPSWHTGSTIRDPSGATTPSGGIKPDPDGNSTMNGVKREEYLDDEDKKPEVSSMQDEVAAYLAEMEREREEAEKRAKQEDAEEDEEDMDEFEDVVGTSSMAGTPMSSSQAVPNSNSFQTTQSSSGNQYLKPPSTVNGIKRDRNDVYNEYSQRRRKYEDDDDDDEFDDEDESASPSEANTPAAIASPAKRVKFESSATTTTTNGGIGIKKPTSSLVNVSNVKREMDGDSDEDEDFEDAL